MKDQYISYFVKLLVEEKIGLHSKATFTVNLKCRNHIALRQNGGFHKTAVTASFVGSGEIGVRASQNTKLMQVTVSSDLLTGLDSYILI